MRSRSRRSVRTGTLATSSTNSLSLPGSVGARLLPRAGPFVALPHERGARAYLSLSEGTPAICWGDSCLQELRDALVGINLVFDPGKAVALVFIHFVFGHAAALFDRIHHLQGFFLGASRIIASGQQKQGRFDLVHKENRGAVVEEIFVFLQVAHGG